MARCSKTRISMPPWTTRPLAGDCEADRPAAVPVAGIAAGADAVMMAHVSYPAGRHRARRLLARDGSATICAATMGFPRRGVQRRHRHGRGRVRWRHRVRACARTTRPAAIRCWCAHRRWCADSLAAIGGRDASITAALRGPCSAARRAARDGAAWSATARWRDARASLALGTDRLIRYCTRPASRPTFSGHGDPRMDRSTPASPTSCRGPTSIHDRAALRRRDRRSMAAESAMPTTAAIAPAVPHR
jgi:hypothetical protein